MVKCLHHGVVAEPGWSSADSVAIGAPGLSTQMKSKFLLAAFASPAFTHLAAVGVARVGSLFFVMLL